MAIQLGDIAPDFRQDSTDGPIPYCPNSRSRRIHAAFRS
jgi:hypothetical protein